MEKKCPMCAELVKQEAKKCKYCGHLFRFSSLTNGQIAYILVILFFVGLYFSTKKTMPETYIFKNFKPGTSGLIVEKYKIIQKKPTLKILGTLKNNGPDTWKFIEVEAKFYDKNENLVDMTNSRSMPLLKSGESADFKIDNCCGDKESPIVFDHLKLKVIDASYVQKNEE